LFILTRGNEFKPNTNHFLACLYKFYIQSKPIPETRGIIMEIKWEPSMSVNENTIDGQHKRLLSEINKIIKILSSLDVDIGQLRETIHFLYTYIKEHFSYEEGYMDKHDFPGLDKHQKIHKEFVQFYDIFQKKLRDKGASPNFSSLDIKELLEEVEKYLRDWLVHHIKGTDQDYAKYIKAHNK